MEFKISTSLQKVEITTLDGTRMWASIYLVEGDRVQDMLNDSRPFLPVLALRDTPRRGDQDQHNLIMLNKSQIFKVEEI